MWLQLFKAWQITYYRNYYHRHRFVCSRNFLVSFFHLVSVSRFLCFHFLYFHFVNSDFASATSCFHCFHRFFYSGSGFWYMLPHFHFRCLLHYRCLLHFHYHNHRRNLVVVAQRSLLNNKLVDIFIANLLRMKFGIKIFLRELLRKLKQRIRSTWASTSFRFMVKNYSTAGFYVNFEVSIAVLT